MRTRTEIEKELIEVRKILKDIRECGGDSNFQYGAQQALVWILGEARSPSEVEELLIEIAANLEDA